MWRQRKNKHRGRIKFYERRSGASAGAGVDVASRAANEGPRSFHNYGEGPNKGLLLVESAYWHIHS